MEKQDLVAELYLQGESCPKIADFIQVPLHRIEDHLKAKGIPRRPCGGRHTADYLEKIQEAILDQSLAGLDKPQIAKNVNLSVGAVSRRLQILEPLRVARLYERGFTSFQIHKAAKIPLREVRRYLREQGLPVL